jgi:hypothetical protein
LEDSGIQPGAKSSALRVLCMMRHSEEAGFSDGKVDSLPYHIEVESLETIHLDTVPISLLVFQSRSISEDL